LPVVKHRQLARQVGVLGALRSRARWTSTSTFVAVLVGPRRQLAAALVGPGRQLAVLMVIISVVRGNSDYHNNDNLLGNAMSRHVSRLATGRQKSCGMTTTLSCSSSRPQRQYRTVSVQPSPPRVQSLCTARRSPSESNASLRKPDLDRPASTTARSPGAIHLDTNSTRIRHAR